MVNNEEAIVLLCFKAQMAFILGQSIGPFRDLLYSLLFILKGMTVTLCFVAR